MSAMDLRKRKRPSRAFFFDLTLKSRIWLAQRCP